MQKVFGSKNFEDKHSPGSSINCLVRNDIASTKREKKVKSVFVAVIGQGEIFGDYETFNEKSTHQFSLVCKSLTGELLCIDRHEFQKKVYSSTAIHQSVLIKSLDKCLLYSSQASSTFQFMQQRSRKNQGQEDAQL